jgi:hypothetical protein
MEFRDLKTGRAALILNSRQSKYPVGADQWVRNSVEAATHAKNEGYSLICSYGMNTWELITYLASKISADTVLLASDQDLSRVDFLPSLLREYRLKMHKVEVVPVHMPEQPSAKSWWVARDQTAIEMCSIVYPISINGSGNLWGMLQEIDELESVIDERFAVKYRRPSTKQYSPLLHSEVVRWIDEDWNHITHWTRRIAEPWPGEDAFEYYDSVIRSTDEYSHSALKSLINILKTGKLCGSEFHIRGGHRVVALTELPPHHAVELMAWRSRFVRWSFEPYGIAIDKEYALELGIRPVIYGKHDIYEGLTEEDKPLFQNEGEKAGDWRPEREWRYVGDIQLDTIPSDRMTIIVRRSSEIEIVKDLTDSRVVALTRE